MPIGLSNPPEHEAEHLGLGDDEELDGQIGELYKGVLTMTGQCKCTVQSPDNDSAESWQECGLGFVKFLNPARRRSPVRGCTCALEGSTLRGAR